MKEGEIQIDHEVCNACGVCVSFCPYGALYIERAKGLFAEKENPRVGVDIGKKLFIESRKCIECGECEYRCPKTEAIRHTGFVETQN